MHYLLCPPESWVLFLQMRCFAWSCACKLGIELGILDLADVATMTQSIGAKSIETEANRGLGPRCTELEEAAQVFVQPFFMHFFRREVMSNQRLQALRHYINRRFSASLTYGRWIWDCVYFVVYVLWEILVSNISLARLILRPNPVIEPGILAVPLRATTTLEVLVLASVISLTPGTLTLDLGKNATGESVLYVHNLTVGDPVVFRAKIKNSFERLLLRVTRGRNESQ